MKQNVNLYAYISLKTKPSDDPSCSKCADKRDEKGQELFTGWLHFKGALHRTV